MPQEKTDNPSDAEGLRRQISCCVPEDPSTRELQPKSKELNSASRGGPRLSGLLRGSTPCVNVRVFSAILLLPLTAFLFVDSKVWLNRLVCLPNYLALLVERLLEPPTLASEAASSLVAEPASQSPSDSVNNPPDIAGQPQVPTFPPSDGRIDFSHQIVPIIRERCATCHTGNAAEGGISFNTRESILEAEVVVPGNPGESILIERVTTKDRVLRMPPEGPPLTPEQVALLRQWIAEGLQWEPGFSFAPPSAYEAPLTLRQVTIPPEEPGLEHPLDRLVAEYFRENGQSFPQTIDDRRFARRVYFDLIGLPPTPDELAEFLGDRDPNKRAKLISNLLANHRAYADHWLSFWNDLLRNDYTGTGYIDGGRKQITEWLYRALYENWPYDRFIRGLITPDPGAEGFIRGIKWRGNVNASQRVELQFSQTTAQVFLGINMKCASCHDSFVDKWKLTDAYGLAAIVAEEPLEIHRCDKPTGQVAAPGFVFPELGSINPAAPAPERLRQYAELLTHPENGRTSRTLVNRIWHRLMGRGLVHPVDAMDHAPWSESLLDYLAGYLVQNGWDIKKLLEHMTTSKIYQAECASVWPDGSSQAYVFQGPLPRRLTAEQFVDTLWRLTGAAPAKPIANLGIQAEPAEFVRAALVPADPLQLALGRPLRDVVVSTRPEEMTTLQALDLSIGEQFHAALDQGGVRLLKLFEGQPAANLIQRVFLSTLCRPPTPEELQAASAWLCEGDSSGQKPAQSAEVVADFLWTVLMLPEFQTIR